MSAELTSACTPEQRAEWNALHDRIATLDKRHGEALRDSGQWLKWGIERGEMEFAQKRALEVAQEAVDLWVTRMGLSDQAKAHPYQAEVEARSDAARAVSGR